LNSIIPEPIETDYEAECLLTPNHIEEPITMQSAEERQRQHRADLDTVMNALVDQRRKIVAKAMVSLKKDKVPPTLASDLANVQNGINAVALAARQEEMFGVVCKHWDYLLLPPMKRCEEIER
jgi:hypothetical protein